jgi:hypothetical protein
MNKNDKTNMLFSGIGEIDDGLLEEAMNYKSSRRKSFNFGMLAACLALILVISVTFPMLNRTKDAVGNSDPEKIEGVPETYTSLDSLLMDSYGGSYQKLNSFDSLSYTDSASLIWQYVDSGEIYVKRLSSSELEEVTESIGRGAQVGEESPEIGCKMWVLDGEGNVISPYLKGGAGNVDCTVFDYEVEIIPDESFVECISDILH